MNKVIIMSFMAVIAGFSNMAMAVDASSTLLKSVVYYGNITGQTVVKTDKVCKLQIDLIEYSNPDHPNGPVKNQYISFRLFTAKDKSALDKIAIWQAENFSTTNADGHPADANVSALPIKIGKSDDSSFDGSTLYFTQTRGDAIYTGRTTIWIKNVSPKVFDSKPNEVRVFMKGGNFFPINTEADYACAL